MSIATFINDYDIILPCGKYAGKELRDIPVSYFNWLLDNDIKGSLSSIRDACIRIINRQSVTKLLSFPEHTMFDVEINKITPIERPDDINPQYFGLFIEFCIKSQNGITHFPECETRLVECGLLKSAKLRSEFPRPPKHFDYIYLEAYNKLHPTYMTLAVLADSTGTNWEKMQQKLQNGYDKCIPDIKIKIEHPERAISISVGSIIGIIDIVSTDAIWDIKCCIKDEPIKWAHQIYTYWCLYSLSAL
mgnify:FL=1